MNRQLAKRNSMRPSAYAAAALTAVVIIVGIIGVGALLTYRVANTTGVVVAQFLQPGSATTSAQ